MTLFFLCVVVLVTVTHSLPPRDLRVDGKTENALFIRWTAPNFNSSSGRGQVRGYKVTAMPLSTLGSKVSEVIL